MPTKRLFPISVTTLTALALGVACSAEVMESSDSASFEPSNAGSTGSGADASDAGDTAVEGGVASGGVTVLTDEEAAAILGNACNAWSLATATLPAKIEFIVEISRSMGEVASGDTESKWDVTRTALHEAIVGADGSGLSASTAVGLLFYPGLELPTIPTTEQDSTACLSLEHAVPMAPLGTAGTEQRLRLDKALEAVVTGGDTPTHDAYKYALDRVRNGAESNAIAGVPYLLLMTDGLPTLQFGCFNATGNFDDTAVPTQPIIDEIANAASQGIKTFVIGSPGSEAGRAVGGHDWLSAAARAGGTMSSADCSDTGPVYCHMDLTTAADPGAALTAALSDVAAAVTNCTYDLPVESEDGTQQIDPVLINPIVTFAGGSIELIGLDASGTCATEGYRLNGTSQLEFCPSTCRRIQSDPLASVRIVFGCGADDVSEILM